MNKDNLDALDQDFEDEYDVSWEDEVYNDWRISLCIIVYNNNRHQDCLYTNVKKDHVVFLHGLFHLEVYLLQLIIILT